MAMSWSLIDVECCAAMALHLGDVHHQMELAVDLEASEGAGPVGGPTTGATPLQSAALNPHSLSVFKFRHQNLNRQGAMAAPSGSHTRIQHQTCKTSTINDARHTEKETSKIVTHKHLHGSIFFNTWLRNAPKNSLKKGSKVIAQLQANGGAEVHLPEVAGATSLTSWSREAVALRERGLRRRSERGSRRRHGAAPRWAELAGGSGRRAEGAVRRVRVCMGAGGGEVGGAAAGGCGWGWAGFVWAECGRRPPADNGHLDYPHWLPYLRPGGRDSVKNPCSGAGKAAATVAVAPGTATDGGVAIPRYPDRRALPTTASRLQLRRSRRGREEVAHELRAHGGEERLGVGAAERSASSPASPGRRGHRSEEGRGRRGRRREHRDGDVDPGATLLEFLRTRTRFTGPKLGCGEGTQPPSPPLLLPLQAGAARAWCCSPPTTLRRARRRTRRRAPASRWCTGCTTARSPPPRALAGAEQGDGLVHPAEHGVRVAELHPSIRRRRRGTTSGRPAAARRPPRRLRWRRDDGDGALEDWDGVGVGDEAAVDGGGDVEAHGEHELGALAAALERQAGPLGELKRAQLLEENGHQIRVGPRGLVSLGRRRGTSSDLRARRWTAAPSWAVATRAGGVVADGEFSAVLVLAKASPLHSSLLSNITSPPNSACHLVTVAVTVSAAGVAHEMEEGGGGARREGGEGRPRRDERVRRR
ncbi:hypothetical protein EJB05_24264, partial [Eragrostis curvula]